MAAHGPGAPDDPARAYGGALRDDAHRRRERERRRYGPRRGAATWIWWAIAIVGLALFALLMRGVIEKTKWTAGDVAAPQAPATSRPAPDGPVRVSCYELADPYSRTYVDRCDGKGLPPTPA
ncbi:MAG TPA: hypothetical protein VFE72_01155, partial [Lysobacter sp.]|nr:hypothetical protein [Lysobacter sp.]